MGKNKVIKSYKGFDKDLKCRDFQYEIGKEYETNKAECCESGFHACEYPLDCFQYYVPSTSRYCEVEQSGDIAKDNDGTKIASTKIKIVKEIGLPEIIDASIEYIKKRAINDSVAVNSSDESIASNSGYRSVASNSGYRSVASNSGLKSIASNSGLQSVASNSSDESIAVNSGDWSIASNSGDWSVAVNSGDWSIASNSGYRSVASNSGLKSIASNSGTCSVAVNSSDESIAVNSGDWSIASNSGDWSVAVNSGNNSVAEVSKYESVACALGIAGKAKGKIGCWLVISEWQSDYNYNWHRVDTQCVKVDGKVIKEDTYYSLKNGKFVEVKK